MRFLPVLGYEGYYEVSSLGEVRSVDRVVVGTDGVHYPRKGRVLRPYLNKNVEYPQIALWRDNQGTTFYVHRLVAEAHIPNPKKLPEVNHKNGFRFDNRKSNLEWVTSLENKLHAIQTGLRVYTNRLTKEEFIECLDCVLDGESYASLSTRVPYKVPFLSTKIRSIARELQQEHLLDASLMEQRVARARVNGAKNK